MKIFATLKKTVTSMHDVLDTLGLNRNKPRFLFISEKDMMDPAGNPRTNVYRRDVGTGSGPEL
jgi:hypothetical protein